MREGDEVRRALLAGEQIELRPLEPADGPRLLEFVAVPEVRRSLRLPAPDADADAAFVEALLAPLDPRETLLLAVVARDDHRLVGLCGLHRTGEGTRQAELGIFIGDPREWGKGFGSEATRLLAGFAFRELELDRIRLEVHADHTGAIRAYERAGFRLDRVRTPVPASRLPPGGPAQAPTAGGEAPIVGMSVLRSEWSRED